MYFVFENILSEYFKEETGEESVHYKNKQTNKQTPWPLVRKRTIPTEQPPSVQYTYIN
jgi:hypothetical protein